MGEVASFLTDFLLSTLLQQILDRICHVSADTLAGLVALQHLARRHFGPGALLRSRTPKAPTAE